MTGRDTAGPAWPRVDQFRGRDAADLNYFRAAWYLMAALRLVGAGDEALRLLSELFAAKTAAQRNGQ